MLEILLVNAEALAVKAGLVTENHDLRAGVVLSTMGEGRRIARMRGLAMPW